VRITGDLRERGWCLTDAAALGWPGPQDVLGAFSSALAPDPRGPGKRHARDVIRYSPGRLVPAGSITFTSAAGEAIDDFSRFDLLGAWFGRAVASTVLDLIPAEHRLEAGSLSADYFCYSAGVVSAPHRDGFGSYVVIWSLLRAGSGGESFLIRDDQEVLTHALEPGEVLIFRDELFLHGVRAMRGEGARRDVLILITVNPS
jgi:hypothetical protein